MKLFEQAALARNGRYFRTSRSFAASAANYNKLQLRMPSGVIAQLIGIMVANPDASNGIGFILYSSSAALSATAAGPSSNMGAGAPSSGAQAWYSQDSVDPVGSPGDANFSVQLPANGFQIIDLSDYGYYSNGSANAGWVVMSRTVNRATPITLYWREFP